MISTPPPSTQLITFERDEHPISRRLISKNALNVLYGLNEAGFEAYLVGGGIRDILLGQRPKDFDIATNATPEQVVKLFKRSRVVGRRFKIAHVRFGREIIEVTTFRAAPHAETQQRQNAGGSRTNARYSEQNEQGMLLRDNVYGSLIDDALRRDFTINALYYTVDGFKLLDYIEGMQDLHDKRLRIIGNAEARYREDPVRMLRAIRFKAKLNFELDPDTEAPISALAPLLTQVSSARMFDEINKLLLSTYASRTFELLQEYQLLDPLFPHLVPLIADRNGTHFQLIIKALKNTEERITNDKPVTAAFLYACLIWPRILNISASAPPNRTRWDVLRNSAVTALSEQNLTTSIPNRFADSMRDIWGLQNNLEFCSEKTAVPLLGHPRFRAAYDFMIMREAAGETLTRPSQFWTDLQIDHPEALYKPEKKRRTPQNNKQSNKKRYSNKPKNKWPPPPDDQI